MIKSIKKKKKATVKNTVKMRLYLYIAGWWLSAVTFCTERNALSSCQEHRKANKSFFLDLNIPLSF